MTQTGSLLAIAAFVAVGSSVAAAEELAEYPVAGGQAARYALAAVLLMAVVRFRLRRPARRELRQLVAVSGTGLVRFNIMLAALVQGAGGELPVDARLLSLGALVCEAWFGLLARPLFSTFGPAGLSTWIVALAVLMLAAVGLAADGVALVVAPTGREAIALGYMAVVVAVAAFVAWYAAIARLGVERAGLFSGVLPITALLDASWRRLFRKTRLRRRS